VVTRLSQVVDLEESPPGFSCSSLLATMASAYDSHSSQPLTNPTTWPLGPSCDVHSCMGFLPQAYPAPWAYTWVPWGTSLWTARPLPVPLVWSRDASGCHSCMSNQHPATLASGLAPYFRGPPAPDSSVPPTLAGDVLSCCPQEGHETPASSAPRSAVGDPSRGASYRKKCQAPLSECTFSSGPIWAPWSPSSPELHPLPPSPIQDPQSPPRSPGYPQRSPCRARRCLFEP
jgi:hypothetical protein